MTALRRAALLALAFAAQIARADPAPRARLVYARLAGAEGCPDEPSLRGAVAARLGYDPFRDDAPRSIAVAIEGAGRGLRARISILDEGRPAGAQVLASPDRACDELGRALALALSIAVDPLGELRPPAPPPEEPPPPSPLPIRRVPQASDNDSPRRAPPAEPLRLRGSLGLVSTLNVAADPSFGFTLAVGLRRTRWSVDLELRGDLPAAQQVAGGQIKLALIFASIVPCLRFDPVALCVLASAGVQLGSGFQATASVTEATPFLAAGARIATEIPFFQVMALRFHGDLLVALSETSYYARGDPASAPPLFTTSRLSGALGLAVLAYLR